MQSALAYHSYIYIAVIPDVPVISVSEPSGPTGCAPVMRLTRFGQPPHFFQITMLPQPVIPCWNCTGAVVSV